MNILHSRAKGQQPNHTASGPSLWSQAARWFAALSLAILSLAAVPGAPTFAQDSPGISSPAPGAAINGDVPILGTAVIDTFQKYELHYKQEPSGNDAFIYFAGGTAPVVNGQLGVWSAGGLPPGAYTIRLRVVKADGNYAEYFAPNVSVNQAPAGPTPTETPTETTETPTPTATFTPAPQPTPVIGQVAQPSVEGDEPAPTATPAPAAPEDAGQTGGLGNLLPTPTPIGSAGAAAAPAEGSNLTRELGEAVGMDRLRTQFVNGVRISAAVFIGLAALLIGKRLFVWVWRKYS